MDGATTAFTFGMVAGAAVASIVWSGFFAWTSPVYVDTNRATVILTGLGFTEIRTSLPWRNRGCDDDGTPVKFFATSPTGQRMAGVACLPDDGPGTVRFE